MGLLKSSLACEMKYRSKVVFWLLSIHLFFFFPCGMRFVNFSGSGFEDNFYRMCIALLYVWSLLYIYMKVYSLMVCA